MAPLRCSSFNCRGWNSGHLTLKKFIDSLDICFIQEHWLLNDHLYKINEVSPEFLSISVSGVDQSCLITGRPYGGCSILYRKSLSPFITLLDSGSNRFCALKLCDSNGLSVLMICVYMPGEHTQDAFNAYLNILGELEGFIDRYGCDLNLIIGDFNVDFGRGGSLNDLLLDFMSDLNLTACDLQYQNDILYTYERDDGLVRSWIDHVLSSHSFSHLVSDIYTQRSGSNLSDHFPLHFLLHVTCLAAHYPPPSPSFSPSRSPCILWHKVSSTDIEKYQSLVGQYLPTLSPELVSCSETPCSCHNELLEVYAQQLVSTLLDCAFSCFPCSSPSPSYRLAGWNDTCQQLKDDANLWYKIWEQAGRPSSGALFNIRRYTKRKYKSSVRRLQRRQQYLRRERLARSYAEKKMDDFWTKVKQLNHSSTTRAPVVDGVSGSLSIANLFASNLDKLLNMHSPALRDALHDSVQSSLSASQLQDVVVTVDDVVQAIRLLKKGKSDNLGLSSDHLKYACLAIADSLAPFFTACLRHGFLPRCVTDCVLIPIPKGNKDTSCSKNYRPIALASTMSKVMEHIILIKYGNYFCSSQLQFGFKAGSSTTACTAMIKMVVSRYINSGSKVYGCFLDASKAFDRVDHGLLFQKLVKRGLPPPILNFLLSWYRSQKMRVQWSPGCLSNSFNVSNGVRQGGVLSPFLFAVYLDGLLDELSASGVGCYWRWMFAGVFCYADDIALLAPSASALRRMLSICSSYATSHGLLFNAEKTQMICFRRSGLCSPDDVIYFDDIQLKFSESVLHLGHSLSYDLNDKEDITRAIKDINRKANMVLYTFRYMDPFILTYLFKMYCLALYGCTLWSLSSPFLKSLQVSVNKILRKIWHLPRNSHTTIVLSTAKISFIPNLICCRFSRFISRCLSCELPVVKTVTSDSLHLAYSFVGYNSMFSSFHEQYFNENDVHTANIIRSCRHVFGFHSPFEDFISRISS